MAGIIARPGGGGDYEQIPAGSYVARCFKIIDLGTQPQTWQGKPAAHKQEADVYFEVLTDEDDKPVKQSNGEPFIVRKRYKVSTNKKSNMRKDIDLWRGKALTDEEADEFDITKLIEAYARIQVVLETKGDKTYTNISAISHTNKKPKSTCEPSFFTMAEPDMEMFETFPQWMKDKIAESQEWVLINTAGDDDVFKDEPAKEKPGVETEDINVDEVAF